MAKGKKEKKERGRNDVESSFVVIFAPPARKNSKRRRKREGRERGKSVSARRSFPRAERHN